MNMNIRTLFAVLLCCSFFIACEPEALPQQESMTKISRDIDPVGESGNEQNDVDHRGES